MPSDIRQMWLDTIKKYYFNPTTPGSDQYWSPELDTASRSRILEIQSEKMEVGVRFLYKLSPFWKKKFDDHKLRPSDIKSVEDLHKIPITTSKEISEDMAAHPPWGTCTTITNQVLKERGSFIYMTTGTTGRPKVFRFPRLDLNIQAWADARAAYAMGIRGGESALICFGYGPHGFMWGLTFCFSNLMGVTVIPGGGMDSRMRGTYVDTLQPTILAATPSYLLYLGEYMKNELGIDPAKSSVKFLICGGEPGASIPATKKRIEGLWNAELFEYIGFTEAATHAGGYTCRVGKEAMSPHLMDDLQIFEVVDPKTFEPLPEGERGVVLCTNLCSEMMPIPRFLVGDLTTITTEPCACGRTHRRAIGGFCGRIDDMLLIRGINVLPSTIEQVVRGFKELGDEYMIVVDDVKGYSDITVHVEPMPEIPESQHEELYKKLVLKLRSNIEVRPTVALKPHGTLPRTEFKANRIKDLRKHQ